MLGPPIDAWYVWLGASLVSLIVLGVAVTAVPDPPSEAPAAAETVDAVAASEPPASGRHPIDADRVRVGAYRLTIESEETRTVPVRYGPVTPAQRDTPLRAVALGTPPSARFESPAAFAAAAAEARETERLIEPAGDLVARTVAWNDVRVTLVTA